MPSFWDPCSSRLRHSCVRFLPIKSNLLRQAVTLKSRRITIRRGGAHPKGVRPHNVRQKTLFAFAAILMIFARSASAHRLDEYLQATRLSLAANQVGVEIDLTPGVDVAPMIFSLINTDHDGRISASEGASYAKQVMQETVLEIDGRRFRLDLLRYEFPSFPEMNTGEGTIRIYARAPWIGTAGPHRLVYQNNHRPDLGVYLVNALRPGIPNIEITEQHRDPLQRGMNLAFVVR